MRNQVDFMNFCQEIFHNFFSRRRGATHCAGRGVYNKGTKPKGGGGMQVEVYADLLFLINAGMDGLCLLITSRLLHKRILPFRMIAAAVLGGVYAVLVLFLSVGRLTALLADAVVCLLMCLAAFGRRGILGASLLYTGLSMALGGVMTALFSLLNRAGVAGLLPDGGDGAEAWIFLAVAAAGGIVTLKGGRLWRRSRSVTVCLVTVTLGGRSQTFAGLVDTGNLLCDPVGGQAVICARPEALSALFAPAVRDAMAAGDPTALVNTPDARRLRCIPTETATGGGMLIGFRPDGVTLALHDKDTPRAVDATVAVMPKGSPPESGTEALVPAVLLP